MYGASLISKMNWKLHC